MNAPASPSSTLVPRTVRRRRFATLVPSLFVAGIVLGACGSDGDSIASKREKLVDELTAEAESTGADIDRDCIAEVAAQLSDSDVDALADAGVDGDANVSADAQDLAMQMANCVTSLGGVTDAAGDTADTPTTDGAGSGSGETIPAGALSAIVDQVAASVEASGGTVDRDCLAAALDGVDLAEIAAKLADPTFMSQFSTCVDAGDGASVTIPGGSGAISDQMVEQVALSIESNGGTVDRDCLKSALTGMSVNDVVSKAADPTFWNQFTECVTGI